MKHGYVVMATHYSYNDEISHSDDEDSGKPVKVFISEAKAEDFCKQYTEKFLAKVNIFDFCYALSDIIKEDVLEPFILSGKLPKDGRDSDRQWAKLSADERKLLLANSRLVPFYVQEVEFSDG